MEFMTENFMLQTETARQLYRRFAADCPIIDYHCHINPQEIAENRRFENITQVWLGGDHYKWRMIRANGVPEREITGDADDRTKFQRFAEALPRAIGNPMYHWTHLELKTYFGYNGVLNGDTAEEVWQLCNKKLQEDGLSVRGILQRSRVEMIGTTDDPADDLHWHEVIAADSTIATKVVPSFRPDAALSPEKPDFAAYIQRLSRAADRPIQTVAQLKEALAARLAFFCDHGCRASDHGLERAVYTPASDGEVERIFQKALAGERLQPAELDAYKTALLLFLAREYHRHGIVMQLHYSVVRNQNTRLFRALGPDAGFDVLHTNGCGENLLGFLNALDETAQLPKTIVYSLNPADNELLDTVIGCFQGEEIAGKIQHGAAWWFNDTKTGMEQQLISLANLSLLGNFVGMLTDSRSFLSYTRHDYFRRILCNLIGRWVEDGEYPCDEAALEPLIRGICCENARAYFGLK